MENKMHKTFLNFINEAQVGIGDQYNSSLKIIRFLEKKLDSSYSDFDGQDYTNNEGNFFGFLFVNKKDGSAIRINWDGKNFHSINFWQSWNYNKDPMREIKTKDLGPGDSQFTRLLPDIADIILNDNSFDEPDEDDVSDVENEENLTEAHKIEYNGEIYNGKQELVRQMYNNDKTLAEIQNATGLSPQAIKSIVATHIKNLGGSVSEVATALNVSNQEARELCGQFVDEETFEYNPAITISGGLKETVTPTKQLKSTQALLEDIKYADPDLVFDEISDYVTLAAKGLLPSLLITGQNGIGKVYNIDKILDQFGKKQDTWTKISGKTTTESIYETLWKNNDKIVVFENCDNIFKDPDSIVLINKLFENTESRELSIGSQKDGFVYASDLDNNVDIADRVNEWSSAHDKDGLPDHFIFEGQAILITNMDKAELFKKDEELLNKCTSIDIVSSAQDVIKRMETILPNIKIYKALANNGSSAKDITDESLKQEVFNFIKSDEFLKNPKVRGKSISIRTLNDVYKLKWIGFDNWKDRAFASV